jgi:hypothetical protein
MRRQLPGSQKPFRLFRDSERELAHEQARRRLRRPAQLYEDMQVDDKLVSSPDLTGNQSAAPAIDISDRTRPTNDCCRVNPDDLLEHGVPHESYPDAGFIDNQGKEVSCHEQGGQGEPDWPFGGREAEASQVAAQSTPDTPSSLIFGELATAYVPWQMFGQTLSLRDALRTGTLFPELVRTVPLYQKPPGT